MKYVLFLSFLVHNNHFRNVRLLKQRSTQKQCIYKQKLVEMYKTLSVT